MINKNFISYVKNYFDLLGHLLFLEIQFVSQLIVFQTLLFQRLLIAVNLPVYHLNPIFHRFYVLTLFSDCL